MGRVTTKKGEARPRKWLEPIYEAVACGRRFDHAEDCQVRFYANGKTKGCKCGASAANEVFNEIAEEWRVGIPIPT